MVALQEPKSVQVEPAAVRRRGPGPLRKVIAGLLVLSVGGVAAIVLAKMPANKTETPPVEEAVVNVETLTVAPLAEVEDHAVLPGTIEPFRMVKVAAEVGGRIERYAERVRQSTWRGRTSDKGRPIDEGEPISAGEPILYLNKDLLEAEYARVKAQHEFAVREYDRMARLGQELVANQKELDDARTQRDMARAAMTEVEERLKRTTIYAPIGGAIEKLPFEAGEYVAPGDVVAVIVDIAKVKVVVDVPERDVSVLSIGARQDVLLNGDADKAVGQITFIGEMAAPNTRTTRIEITLDNPELKLRAGQIVRVRLVRGVLHNVIMVPLRAVIPLEEGKEVYVVVNGRAERRGVELGFIRGSEVRIVRGLSPGDSLIVAGHQFVAPGQRVNVIGPTTRKVEGRP